MLRPTVGPLPEVERPEGSAGTPNDFSLPEFAAGMPEFALSGSERNGMIDPSPSFIAAIAMDLLNDAFLKLSAFSVAAGDFAGGDVTAGDLAAGDIAAAAISAPSVAAATIAPASIAPAAVAAAVIATASVAAATIPAPSDPAAAIPVASITAASDLAATIPIASVAEATIAAPSDAAADTSFVAVIVIWLPHGRAASEPFGVLLEVEFDLFDWALAFRFF